MDKYYKKYIVPSIDFVIEGIQDGRDVEKLKTIVPLTNLNLVSLIECIYVYDNINLNLVSFCSYLFLLINRMHLMCMITN